MYNIDYPPYKLRDWIDINKLDWCNLSLNPSIFEIDYQVLKNSIEPFKEELIQKCFHPDRLIFYLEQYNYNIGDDYI